MGHCTRADYADRTVIHTYVISIPLHRIPPQAYSPLSKFEVLIGKATAQCAKYNVSSGTEAALARCASDVSNSCIIANGAGYGALATGDWYCLSAGAVRGQVSIPPKQINKYALLRNKEPKQTKVHSSPPAAQRSSPSAHQIKPM